MLWMIAAALVLPQDDLCPLREGMALTYEVKERTGTAESLRDRISTVSGTRAFGGDDWLEVSDFLFYEKAYLRVGPEGFEFRAPEYGEHTLLLFKKGARAGDSWSCDLSDEERVHYRVEADETVDVPAGRYQAYRISFLISETRKRAVGPEAEGAIWFAPGTGIVKGWINREIDCQAGVSRSFALKKIETR